MLSPVAAPWYSRRPLVERTREVARILAHHGLQTLAEQAGLARFLPRLGQPPDSTRAMAQRLRLALGELGVTFIKLGQTLSTRGDLLPPEFVTELATLQDAAPTVPAEHIVRTIEEDLGDAPEKIFAAFDRTPLASASIGQVHAARLQDGSPVVVKVRRPGVVDEVERDLEILTRIVTWAQANTALGNDIDLLPLVHEFAYTLRNELDYVREGRNAERLGRAFANDPSVWIPRVHWPHTTTRVLTLERVGGIKASDLATLDRLAVPRRAIAENAVRMFLRELLELGFFHADPHPGNFFVQPDGSIAVVDFGMVGRVTESTRENLLRAGLAAIEQDADRLAEALFVLGVAGRRADRPAFVRDLDHLLGSWQGRSISDLTAAAITGELSTITYRHHLQLPGDLALLLRVITMSEGLGLMLDPQFHYLEFASPLVREHWRRRHSPRRTAGRVGRAMSEAADLSLELPRRTDRLLGRVERGELELNVRHEGLERMTREFQGMTNRLALAMVLAASVVALGVALGVHGLRGIEGLIRVLFTFGLLFSLASGLWLIASIWRAGKR